MSQSTKINQHVKCAWHFNGNFSTKHSFKYIIKDIQCENIKNKCHKQINHQNLDSFFDFEHMNIWICQKKCYT